LAKYIRKVNTIPEKEAINILGQIIQGMSAMQEKKIIHRDLKPENIMFKNGKVKIVDFGLARKFCKG
jgi:serine/threonine protein kinase